MARKMKVDNAILKRIKNREMRRKSSNRPIRQRYLIVCEGEKTEKNYFSSYQRDLPRGVIFLDIIGAGDNTLNIVTIAINKRDEANRKSKSCIEVQPYDQVWAVFDKDDFPNRRFNDAIMLADREGIKCAYSIEAFELWYLLHFDFHQTAHSREVYGRLLSQYLGEEYDKADPHMYSKLKIFGNQNNAIRWSDKLYNNYNHQSPANENPSTTVYQLVNELNQYIK